ncbi:putative lipoprotein (plasmid) [Ochrobactrum quorumnocens]|uniref:Putative lipoprotein n=1 Tax=Ochrobactrum quorumnocens TaxID=271865 RepID=A0A248UN81_9HYPH|nr:putative lipoprotein [[Ochrobactrum] quorumnocens]
MSHAANLSIPGLSLILSGCDGREAKPVAATHPTGCAFGLRRNFT